MLCSLQHKKTNFLCCSGSTKKKLHPVDFRLGWRQDNGNGSNQESKFDFLATHQCLVEIDEGQQKIKIVRTN